MKALVFGSANIDRTYSLKRFVTEGETVSCTGMQEACGGKGFNQAFALKRAGIDTYFAGAIGQDGGMLADALQDAGIDVSNLKRRHEPTGHAVIQLDERGKNCIIVYPGANGSITSQDVDETLGFFGPGDLLVVQNEMPNTDRAIGIARSRGMTIAVNPSPFDERILTWNIGAADYLFVNEVEGAGLSGVKEPGEVLSVLHVKYPDTCVILTLGGDGSCCISKDGTIARVDAMSVEVADTTAAGDTFTGYFLAEVLSGEDLDRALYMATVASGIAVSRMGAAPSIPMRAEVLAKVGLTED